MGKVTMIYLPDGWCYGILKPLILGDPAARAGGRAAKDVASGQG